MKRVISEISQWTALTLLVTERWKKKPRPFVITLTGAPKTWEQLGYLHTEVLPKLTIALFDGGEIKYQNEREAKYWLKVKINYGQWIEYKESLVFDPDSFEKASIEVLISAIDKAIDEANARGVYVAPPRKRLTKKGTKNESTTILNQTKTKIS